MDIFNIIDEAVRQSQKTRCTFRLGAVIYNRHRIISAGYNRVYSKSGFDSQGNCAEVLAIKKAPKELLKNSCMLVCRVTNSGTFGMAKPCPRCEKLIIKSGIKKVIYSTPSGWKKLSM